MRSITREFEYGRGVNHFVLYGLGDIHAGGIIDEEALDNDIKEIKENPLALWFGMGDYCDFIQRRDKRFNPETIVDWALSAKDICAKQVEYIVDRLKPISNKCIGLLEGNHERTILERWERDIYEQIYLGLGVPPLGYSSTICLMFRRCNGNVWGGTRTLPIYLHHGIGGPSDSEERSLHFPISKLTEWPNARVCLMGHLHTVKSAFITKEFITPHGIKSKDCLAARTGSYLRSSVEGATTYSEIRGYRPNAPGCFYFYYKPETDLITQDYRKVG